MEVWRRPTAEEQVQGYIAMLQHVAYIKGQFIPYDSQGKTMWLGYRPIMIERRIKRGGVLPYWITPIRSATVAPQSIDLDDVDGWLQAG